MHPPLERTHSPSLLSSLNSDGELTYEELRISCRKTLGISPAVLSDKHIRLLFSALDDDQSGNLDLDEFVDFLIRGPNAVRDKIDASMAKKAAKQHERARKTDSPLLSSPRRTPRRFPLFPPCSVLHIENRRRARVAPRCPPLIVILVALALLPTRYRPDLDPAASL